MGTIVRTLMVRVAFAALALVLVFSCIASAQDKEPEKMRLKELKKILADRGAKCVACLEKEDFVKRVKETAHMKVLPPAGPPPYYVEGKVKEIVDHGEIEKIVVGAAFVAVGHTPNTKMFGDSLTMDQQGYLQVLAGSTKTTIEGVFAAGDVSDKVYRQAVTSAGTGAMAALDAERWLSEAGLGVE